MNNPNLNLIINNAVSVLSNAYGSAGVAEGDDITIIHAFPDGKVVEIRITEKSDES